MQSDVWSLTHTGDFNGDGESDSVWRNSLTGETGLWLHHGAALFGGTPVVRETPQGAVAQAVAMIESEPAAVLGIAPEGTRTRGMPWRSGFYHIAHAARAPILPVAFDGGRRAVRLFPPFETSGDYEADLPQLMALYEGIRGVRDQS
jgi:1-acyl-sn-glycerol-3-phosphate acyltransferase